MAELRSATGPSHRRLEKRLKISDRFGDLSGYRAYVQGMWGFCATLEESLSVQSFEGELSDYDERRKLPLLRADLQALGVAESSLVDMPRCRALPKPSNAAFAFGCLYVLEGATLGGRTLLPLVEKRLGFNAAHGALYLASYGTNVSEMWRVFNLAADTWCFNAERRSCATQAAVLTFDVLTDWLCGDNK